MDTVSANNESGGPSNTRATEPPTLPEPPTNPNFSGPTIDVPPRRPFSPGPFARIEPGLSGPFRVRDGAGSSRSGIFDPAMLDNPPQTRFQGTPAYPFEAKQAGQSGEVIVEFAVDGDGRVFNARVVSSSNAIFEEPTLRAVSQWRFEPGRRNGKVVSFRMRVPVEFHPNGS